MPMTSERKIAANRINGRRSRGPKTQAGKARASRNAFRHGLAAITRSNPVIFPEIERMAEAMCAGHRDPFLFEQALIIAESDYLLGRVRAERVLMIERLRDSTAIPLTKRVNCVALVEPRRQQAELAWDEITRIKARFGMSEEELHLPLGDPHKMRRLGSEPACGWRPAPPVERDESDALCKALPDLERLARYERRAWSRRKRAFRRFIEINLNEGPLPMMVRR